MGRAANQNVNDSSEFTVTGSHLIDLDRPAAGERARSVHKPRRSARTRNTRAVIFGRASSGLSPLARASPQPARGSLGAEVRRTRSGQSHQISQILCAVPPSCEA
jgi:hypothetical protein